MSISNNLSAFLLKQGDAARFDLINHHALWGFTYKNWSKFFAPLKDEAKKVYLKQWLQNQTYQKVLKDLIPQILKIDESLLVLKGMNHLDDLYKEDIAIRFMSDIDLLVDPKKMEQIKDLFESLGFIKNTESKWFGDKHKMEFQKVIDGVSITIELHTKLFYHLEHFTFEKEKKDNGSWQLKLEERLVFLCTHYAFQHTMLKLYWFIDIALLIEMYPNIDWNRCKEIAKNWQVKQSFLYTIGAINQFWNPIAPALKGRFQSLISEELIWNKNQRSIRYLLAKNLFKDSITTNLRYSLLWLVRKNSNKQS